MSVLERAALAALRRIDPETAHGLALTALRWGIAPLPRVPDRPALAVTLAGLRLANPLGLAAGFDKNAVALAPLGRAGFGWVEVGAATPRPQPGNPRPRLFRLPDDQAAINRFGFNNDGMAAIRDRLARRPDGGPPVGLNLGANKDSTDRAGDFAQVLTTCGPVIDFATVNVSSPNTGGLRDLQARAALADLLDRVMAARARLARPVPVFLKIAPDLTDEGLSDIAEVALATGVDAIISTNTTIARESLKSASRDQTGGLSGQPLFETSTRVLARLHAQTDGRIPLVGVGGIGSAEQAWQKIRAGATALQLYTALSYRGLSLVPEILSGLDARRAAAGFATLADATGTGRSDWT
ncbi:MAG: quinone-dependent dihydroorotate dehydrogenase [Rhodobacteraceae bacterium]|jgi:dihydroorotate dehydrogenase|nr:quinone-dependent dihydroorotate dehydrogenase [Paracoccaceae bacterium]